MPRPKPAPEMLNAVQIPYILELQKCIAEKAKREEAKGP